MSGVPGSRAQELVVRRALALPHVRLLNRASHAWGLAPVGVLALWLLRHVLFGSGVPAGTDMLGFISRARLNARASELLSVWAPTGLGARRQVTFDNVLGLITLATRDPFLTVKLVFLVTVLASGVSAYVLAWSWYRSRVVAAVAAILYLTSQSILSRWATAVLNVEIALALLPLVVWLWVGCVERFTVRRSIGLALVLAALFLVRPDMPAYIVPFLALYLVVRLVCRPARPALLNVVRTLVVVLPSFAALVMIDAVPIAAGVRARWLTFGGLFNLDEFRDRSLGVYESLLGMGRETGYLGFVGQQTWFAHPWLPLWAYRATATLVVLLAFAALRWRRDERTLFLAAAAVVATFLAKGFHPPLGTPYRWAIFHVPVFGNLREPNRWLIGQALAYAVLAGLTLDVLRRRLRGRVAFALVPVALVLLLPVGPTLLSGFRTWHPTRAQLELMRTVARDPAPGPIATVPFDQVVRYVSQPGYQGFEHDLGAESGAWTDKPTLADGGWHQQVSDSVAFQSTLLRARDPAFASLLGATGISRLVRFDYPETSPHLVSGATRQLQKQDRAAGETWQQRALHGMPGLTLRGHNGAGAVYALDSATPALSLRPNLAVVLGGRAGLAALADLPGVDLRAWAAVTADTVLAQGRLPQLLALMRRARVVLVANDRLEDVAVLATPAALVMPGITSDPGLDRLTELLPSDTSIRLGGLADERAGLARPTDRATATVDVPKSRALELWARVEQQPTAATLRFGVDGRIVADVTPTAAHGGVFSWRRIAVLHLAHGRHELTVAAAPSLYGSDFEIDSVRLVDPAARARAHAMLRAAVRAAGGRVVYSFDLDRLPLATARPVAGAAIARDAATYWDVLEPDRVTAVDVPGRGARGLGLTLAPGRHAYALLEHDYTTPLDLRYRRYLFLTYQGSGSGDTYRLIADFAADRIHSAAWSFVDSSPGVHTVAFPIKTPQFGLPPYDWSHVAGFRLASDSKDTGTRIEIGPLEVSSRALEYVFTYPVVPSPQRRELSGTGPVVVVPPGASSVRLLVPEGLLGRHLRATLRSSLAVRALPPVPVTWTRTSPTSYRFDVDSTVPGWLVLNQGFDERWEAKAGGRTIAPTLVFGETNGYDLRAGRTSGTVSYRGQSSQRLGAAITGMSFLLLLLFAALAPSLGRATALVRPRVHGGRR